MRDSKPKPERPPAVADELDDWLALSSATSDLELAQPHLAVLIALPKQGLVVTQAEVRAAGIGETYR